MREATLADLDAICGWIGRDDDRINPEAVLAFLHNPMNTYLIEGEGGAMFVWHGPGIFEVHVAFSQRGRDAIAMSHRMLDYMRANHGAEQFWAAVPWDTSKQSRKVRLFTRLMGWKSKGCANLATGLSELFERRGD